jgi:hypothetical protein
MKDMSLFESTPSRGMEVGESIVFCFGRDNIKMMEERGHEIRVLSEDPVIHRESTGATETAANWTHKIDVIEAAMKEFGDVLWTDWDVAQLRPLDEGFEDMVSGGPSVQSSLTGYRRKYASWRSGNRNCLPAGAWLFYRGDSRGAEVLELVRRFLPFTLNRLGENHYHDEHALAMAAEELSGGWRGIDWWEENYEPAVVYHRRAACKLSQIPDGKYFRIK